MARYGFAAMAVGMALILSPACNRSESAEGTHDSHSMGSDRTTVRGAGEQRLTIVQPHGETVRRGNTARIHVRFHRENFTGPVTVAVTDLPAGVEAVDTPRQSPGSEETFVLRASERADLVENYKARVSVTGPGGIQATETFDVTVKQ